MSLRLVVHKYDLPAASPLPFKLALPITHTFLHGATQHGKHRAWFLVDAGASIVTQHFLLVGTGWELNDVAARCYLHHRATWLEADGAFVWHLFQVENIL